MTCTGDEAHSSRSSSADVSCSTSLSSFVLLSAEQSGSESFDDITAVSDVTSLSDDVTSLSDDVTSLSDDVTSLSDDVTSVSDGVTPVSDAS